MVIEMVERDENGRFIKGHKGGPGRPAKTREVRYHEITMSACTFSDWQQIIKKAASQAKRGDSSARKFLADYLLGPPTQKHEIGGKDGGGVSINLSWGDDAPIDD
jgi:hypothetical protein